MISVFELFKIGIGPSSSHTVGPMVAAKRFRDAVEAGGAPVAAITAEIYGSLAWTGRGHGTDLAIGSLTSAVPARGRELARSRRTYNVVPTSAVPRTSDEPPRRPQRPACAQRGRPLMRRVPPGTLGSRHWSSRAPSVRPDANGRPPGLFRAASGNTG